MSLSEAQILKSLEEIVAPHGAGSIVERGMVSNVHIRGDGHVSVVLQVDSADGPKLEPLRQKAEAVIAGIKGVQGATAILTAERAAQASVPDPHGMEKNPKLKVAAKKIIAVASGKGGVGKSTVAANLAINLAKNSQYRIGLLDADIYGPSQPKMFGLEGEKPEFNDEKQIIPPEKYGVRVMSIGFMVDATKALVWRGPMVQSAIYQLFRDVQWAEEGEELDVLIVDMPPGTGDAQLTLAQKIDVDGAIIVSTPQDIALADARKGVEMFKKVGVPILGIIENMSTHVCSNCGHEEHIFGHGGAKAEAERLGVPFLGEIPLSAEIRAKSDAGQGFNLDDEILEGVISALA